LALDNAVDGLQYEEYAEANQSPEVVAAGDASCSADGEHRMHEEQKASEDCLDSSQHLADTDSPHCVTTLLPGTVTVPVTAGRECGSLHCDGL